MSDVFIEGVTDLFGDPVPVSRGKRGRPAHVPTAENRRFVQLMLVCDHGEDRIAACLRITVRTLNRHYFHELADKGIARMKLDMKNMAAIVVQVEAGKPAAMALLDKKIDKLNKRDLAGKYQREQPTAIPVPTGIKEQRKAAAKEVSGRFSPRPTPAQLN